MADKSRRVQELIGSGGPSQGPATEARAKELARQVLQSLVESPDPGTNDLYALGCRLVQLMGGRDPSEFKTPEQERRFLASIPASPEFAYFLSNLVARKPEDRFPSPAAALEALDALSSLVFLPVKRGPRLSWIAIALVAISALVAGVRWTSRRPSARDEPAATPRIALPAAPVQGASDRTRAADVGRASPVSPPPTAPPRTMAGWSIPLDAAVDVSGSVQAGGPQTSYVSPSPACVRAAMFRLTRLTFETGAATIGSRSLKLEGTLTNKGSQVWCELRLQASFVDESRPEKPIDMTADARPAALDTASVVLPVRSESTKGRLVIRPGIFDWQQPPSGPLAVFEVDLEQGSARSLPPSSEPPFDPKRRNPERFASPQCLGLRIEDERQAPQTCPETAPIRYQAPPPANVRLATVRYTGDLTFLEEKIPLCVLTKLAALRANAYVIENWEEGTAAHPERGGFVVGAYLSAPQIPPQESKDLRDMMCIVTDVFPGMPAAQGGMRAGDLVVDLKPRGFVEPSGDPCWAAQGQTQLQGAFSISVVRDARRLDLPMTRTGPGLLGFKYARVPFCALEANAGPNR